MGDGEADRPTERPRHRARHTVSSFVINEKRAARSVYLEILGHCLVSLENSLFPSSQPPTSRLQGGSPIRDGGLLTRKGFCAQEWERHGEMGKGGGP